MMAACIEFVRRIVPFPRARQGKASTARGSTHVRRYLDEMRREELLSELVAEHNATVAPGARQLSEGDLRMLLKFLRSREWIHGARAAAGGARSFPPERGDGGSTAGCL